VSCSCAQPGHDSVGSSGGNASSASKAVARGARKAKPRTTLAPGLVVAGDAAAVPLLFEASTNATAAPNESAWPEVQVAAEGGVVVEAENFHTNLVDSGFLRGSTVAGETPRAGDTAAILSGSRTLLSVRLVLACGAIILGLSWSCWKMFFRKQGAETALHQVASAVESGGILGRRREDFALLPQSDAVLFPRPTPQRSGGGQAGTSSGDGGSAGSSRASSPRLQSMAASSSVAAAAVATESEPEGEPTGVMTPRSSSSSDAGGGDDGVPARPCSAGCCVRLPPFEASADAVPHLGLGPPPLTLRSELREATPSAFEPAGGRVLLLYASPLCYLDSGRRPIPMPQIPFEREWDMLVQAYDEAAFALRDPVWERPGDRRPSVVLAAQTLTASSLRCAVAPVSGSTSAKVLHLSAHGASDHLAAEDGKGTAHFLSAEILQGILDLRRELAQQAGGGLRLVFLNACSLHNIGAQFAEGGIPHVICCSAQLRDSASHVFCCALYSSLFQGATVAQAFGAAVVALRSDPQASTQASAKSFSLIHAEGASGREILFRPELAGHALPQGGGLASNGVAAGIRKSLGQDLVTPATTGSGTGSSMDEVTEESSGSGSECFAPTTSTDSQHEEETTASDSDFCSSDIGDNGASKSEGMRLVPSKAAESSFRRASEGTPAGNGRASVLRPRSPQRRLGVATPRPVANASGLRPPKLPSRRAASTSASMLLHSPFGRAVPAAPEDFLGRSKDVWSVLQHLSTRRAVVICAGAGEASGVGKSAVLGAVHRAFAMQMGGVCIATQFRALNDSNACVPGAYAWIEKVKGVVQAALQEYRPATVMAERPRTMGLPGLLGGGVLRRRGPKAVRGGVSAGFHSLSDPVAVAPALEELIADMTTLAEICEARCREWPAAAGRLLLVLDDCDHLIQQPYFQEAIAEVLKRCPPYRVLLTTHQPVAGAAGGQFKVVHHELRGLAPKDAARLFLRRCQRPLHWGELVAPGAMSPGAAAEALDPRAPVALTAANEIEVLALVAKQSSVAAQRGNPRGLIELASRVGPSLASLADLAPEVGQSLAAEPLAVVAPASGAAAAALADAAAPGGAQC